MPGATRSTIASSSAEPVNSWGEGVSAQGRELVRRDLGRLGFHYQLAGLEAERHAGYTGGAQLRRPEGAPEARQGATGAR